MGTAGSPASPRGPTRSASRGVKTGSGDADGGAGWIDDIERGAGTRSESAQADFALFQRRFQSLRTDADPMASTRCGIICINLVIIARGGWNGEGAGR
jgi:hypothetical protein